MYQPAPISRRGFLQLGLAGGAGAAALTLLQSLGPLPGRYEALMGQEQPLVLNRKELAVLSLFVADVIGARASELSPEQTRSAARVDLELSKHGGRMLADTKAALAVLEHGPLVRGWLSRYSGLDASRRATYLASLQGSPRSILRQTYSGLRFFALFFYYSDERSWPRIGYGGPWVPEKRYVGGNRIANLERLS